MTNDKLYSVIALVTPGILQLLMDSRAIDEKAAAGLLYGSQLYGKLEDAETRLWRLSSGVLFDLLEEELATGEILNWPEEQG
ncbi:MAG: hypothetical protein LBL83_07420 [Clostridiales bacterium]|jgi:hypothetical protein|nr:hypothetical protein [Clostridiales bacterium]